MVQPRIGFQAGLRRMGVRLPAVELMSRRFAEDAIPSSEGVQLLRTFPQPSHEASDTEIGPACQMSRAVRAADGQRHLAGMLGSPRDGGQQQRPAGYRLAMMLRIGQAHEQAPPVVDQRYLRASNRQRLRSCVVKPPQPHWFFNSSNVFSESARSRYN